MSLTTESNSEASSAPQAPAALSFGGKLLLRVGSIGPLGHMPASGTVAVAVAGVPLCWLMKRYLSDSTYLVVTIVFTLASVWLHHVGDRLLGEADSRKLVWDELVGFFFAMLWVPWSLPVVVIAFFVERAIDIIKIPPARWFDRNLHSGWGVVLDDVIAGIYTCAILHLAIRIMPSLV